MDSTFGLKSLVAAAQIWVHKETPCGRPSVYVCVCFDEVRTACGKYLDPLAVTSMSG